jgi:hypothetical protein
VRGFSIAYGKYSQSLCSNPFGFEEMGAKALWYSFECNLRFFSRKTTIFDPKPQPLMMGLC